MAVKKLKEFLDRSDIRYIRISHSPAYTAQEVAANSHVSGNRLAKTVIVKMDGRFIMAVLPASAHIDFDVLRQITGATNVELASEVEFKSLFPGCELGAVPPFGSLFDVDIYCDESLSEERGEIVFSAGSHSELIKMNYDDYERLVQPKMIRMTTQFKKFPGRASA